jgi:activator of HSP90 ATPase
MTSVPVNRRIFAGAVITGLGLAGAARSAPTGDLGISGDHKAIHQEAVFKASPARVYQVLTNAALFNKVVVLSGALQAMKLRASHVKLSSKEGDAFALFGGYITGRQVELTPGVRVVQAWRAGSWAPHIFSIVRFELATHPEGCKLIFDHTGFPNEEAESLANGWREHYWVPMGKVLA